MSIVPSTLSIGAGKYEITHVTIPSGARSYRFKDRHFILSDAPDKTPIPASCKQQGFGYVGATSSDTSVRYTRLMPEPPSRVLRKHKHPARKPDPYLSIPVRVPGGAEPAITDIYFGAHDDPGTQYAAASGGIRAHPLRAGSYFKIEKGKPPRKKGGPSRIRIRFFDEPIEGSAPIPGMAHLRIVAHRNGGNPKYAFDVQAQ